MSLYDSDFNVLESLWIRDGSSVIEIAEMHTKASGLIWSSAPAGDPPDPFTVDMWSVVNAYAAGGQTVTLTITALPADNGLPITDIEAYREGGADWVSLGISAPGTTPIVLATPAGQAIICSLRAVNSAGPAVPGDEKTVTPTAPAAPLGPTDWVIADRPTPGANGANITLMSYADPRGSPVTGYQQRAKRNAGGGYGGWYGFGVPALGIPTAVTFTTPDGTGDVFDVQVRAVNAVGNGIGTTTKQVTCTIGAGVDIVHEPSS